MDKIPKQVIVKMILDGIKWSYETYNFHKCIKEFNEIHNKNIEGFGFYSIPEEFRKKYVMWRKGRIWSIGFDLDNQILYINVGGNKCIKKFYLKDVGIKLKPCIFKISDKHNLIDSGLAVEEKL